MELLLCLFNARIVDVFRFAYWDVENSSEVKGKVYCPFGKGGPSSATFELIQPQ